jgi:hypothetical protein
MGSALCSRPEPATSQRAAASEWILARRRDLRSARRGMGVPVPSCRFHGRHHRFHAFAQTGSDRGQTLPAACVMTHRDRPTRINVDGHPAYATAISELKQSGELGRRCRCRPCPYLNNIVEQDHRFIKKRIAAALWFRSVSGALNTLQGFEAMHMIRKGQVRWLAKGDVVGNVRFVNRLFGITV